MLKLLAMLTAFLLVSLALLALRQHRLELTSQSASIYATIRERHETLLDQQVIIARKTNPWALADSLKSVGVNTGEALRARDSKIGRGGGPVIPAIETDLVAPVR